MAAAESAVLVGGDGAAAGGLRESVELAGGDSGEGAAAAAEGGQGEQVDVAEVKVGVRGAHDDEAAAPPAPLRPSGGPSRASAPAVQHAAADDGYDDDDAVSESFRRLPQRSRCWWKVKHSWTAHRRTLLMSLFFFILGSMLLGWGIDCELICTNTSEGTPIIIVGCLAFIPGAYGTAIFVQYCRGVPGYDPKDLPQGWEHV
eukprot:TRINITY_DN19100_c0_g5_i1.p1 TRINITY_DN19100_c0_g5~~TRINITY_DN19100_c0_g5_i1.p1  ORF type:complete len:229 (+),score=81.52 TRINITY_DN19100_c0_g5_i1:82-687(+)